MKYKSLPIFLFIIVVIFSSCDTSSSRLRKYFIGNEWYIAGELFLRNDSSISAKYYDFEKQALVGDTTFPIILSDSMIIYSLVREKGVYNDGRSFEVTGDTIITDTAFYDFIYINDKPKLILYLQSFPKICVSKNKIKPKPTNNFQREKFEIDGFSIGDLVDRDLLKTRGIYDFDTYTIEDCELKEDKDIKIKIIGYNQIYSIERHNIPDYRIHSAIKVVSNKLGVEPEYVPMRRWDESSDYEHEFYRWNAKGVRIKLERTRYIGRELYRNLLETDKWTLHYDDDVQRTILIEQHKDSNPQSTIIN